MNLGRRKWRFLTSDSSTVQSLSKRLNLVPLVARILSARGMKNPDEVQQFLNPLLSALPKPTQMAGMKKAVDRLQQAIRNQERIAVFGDYDADGVTSTALAVSVLREFGADARPWLANRFGWGYGLSPQAVSEMVTDGRSLILIVDCGTSDGDSIEITKQHNMDVVIVDHHPPSGKLPDVNAMINPHRPDCEFEDKGMASVGLVFYLMSSLRTRLRSSIDIKKFLDFVALGTIADVAPMVGANRILVRKGLDRLGRAPKPGLAALKSISGCHGTFTTETVGFKLGPRINAAGRLGNPEVALQLLLAQDRGQAQKLALKLNELSQTRRVIQEKIKDAALPEARRQAQSGRNVILVGNQGWHQGVIGIVAAHMCDEFERPAAVVGFEGSMGRGSMRAPSGYNLHHMLTSAKDHLEKFGGHAAAAGFSVRAENLDALGSALSDLAKEQAKTLEIPLPLDVDAEAGAEDYSLRVVGDMERIGPFGTFNPEPIVAARKAKVIRIDERTGGHLSVQFDVGGAKIRGFGPKMSSTWPRGSGVVDVAFYLRRNTFRGFDSVEMKMIDAKPSGV